MKQYAARVKQIQIYKYRNKEGKITCDKDMKYQSCKCCEKFNGNDKLMNESIESEIKIYDNARQRWIVSEYRNYKRYC